ncbi:metal-binding protein [filamentous cyanobacterium CCP5]|nr:metal-binding protein [filamentous cyanobacterium CCP5]
MAAAPEATLGRLAQSAISRYLKQATQYQKPVLADTDPENLHQMRVGLRRLRTALQVFAPAIVLPTPAQSSQVGRVARKLGRLRDLDVVAETLEQRYWPDLPEPEQAGLSQVLDQLRRRRQRQFKAVKKLLKGKDYKQLKAALKDWIKQPNLRAIAALPPLQAVPDLVLPLASQTWLHPGWLVGTKIRRGTVNVNTRIKVSEADALIREHSQTLHDLRKQIKRFRYQLKVVADLYGDALDPDLDRLATIQDTLGQLQDSLVMGEVLSQAVPDPQRALPTLLGLMADQRHRAWTQWQSLQKHYLDAQNRVALRQLLAAPSMPLAAAIAPETATEAASRSSSTAAIARNGSSSSRQKDPRGSGTKQTDCPP